MLTSFESPICLDMAQSRMAVQSAPDWEMTEMTPSRGVWPANEAFMPLWVLISPRQLGPSIRAFHLAQSSASSRSVFAPSSSTSLKPAVITQIAPAFAFSDSATASGTALVGTQITDRSMGSP